MIRTIMSFDNTDQILSVFDGVIGFIGSSDLILSPGRLGGNYLTLSGQGNPIWAYKTLTSEGTWTAGTAFYLPSPAIGQGDQTELIWFCDITGSTPSAADTLIQFGVGISPGYGVYVLDGSGTRHYSVGGLWRPLTWNYLEVSASIGASETVTVQLNGEVVLALTGINTKKTSNATANLVALAQLGTSIWFDDVYFCDGVAASHGPANNSFLGDIAVLASFPNAAGHYSQWTPTSGLNYTCVDQFAYTDSAYVSSATASQIDTYKFPATLAVTGNIVGVQENVIARTDGGTHVVAPLYRNGGTDYEQTGAEGTPASTYAAVQARFDYDPNSNAAWTPAVLNAGEFGQELVS